MDNYIDKFYFLGKGELEKAINVSKKYNNMEFLPFCIDTNFWNVKRLDLEKNEHILFVGNDGNRDYKKVFEIAKKCQKRDLFLLLKITF